MVKKISKANAWAMSAIRIIKNYVKYYDSIKDGSKSIKQIFSSKDIIGINGKRLSKNKLQFYYKSFIKFNRIKPEDAQIAAEHFCKDRIQFVKNFYKGNIPHDEPILICNVKNDLKRIKLFLQHYRCIGIKYFVILDNDSSDGTLEWLLHENIDVLSVKEEYSSKKRKGWIMKIMDHYGWNRWYLLADSDELFTYLGMDKMPVQQLIEELQEKDIKRALCFMLDMYAKENYISDGEDEKVIDIEKEYCYFDSDSYYMDCRFWGYGIFGGPRTIYFSIGEGIELLTKYPLVYVKTGDIYGYHEVFPYYEDFNTVLIGALRHYKFLRGDYSKICDIVKRGNYANGSMLYKKYLDSISGNKTISFFYDGSEKFESSSDLSKINLFRSEELYL